MKILFLFIASFISILLIGQTKKVLFLGNSYIYVNDLPSLISNLAQADGKTLVYDQNTPGGYTLQEHSTNTTSLAKIASNDWDFVVIQEQSQMPSFPPDQVENDVYPYAQIIVDSIYANNECSEPLFFMTWGRQNGDQDNCQYYTPLCTYVGMQARLRESYIQMGLDNIASVSPVGLAWKKVREYTNDSINLYSSDGSHPSLYGSYLAACVFYTSIFKTTPVNNSFTSTLTDTLAHLLQKVAYNIVVDSNYIWNHKTANFGFSEINNLSLEFVGTENFLSETWDFGDGIIETTHNPIHEYLNEDVYNVKHIIEGVCYKDTSVITVEILSNEINDIKKSEINIFPNPVKETLNILGDKIVNIKLYNSLFQLIFETKSEIIDFNAFNKGVYFVDIYTKKRSKVYKVIKN